jgi:UDP-N-acetylmuramoyl-tripeptide--D-alanyl-D-alanine ligase
MRLTLGEIKKAIAGGGDIRESEIASSYSIDSRTMQPGALFFAIKGERFDGHDFVKAAIESGAAAAVVAKGWKVDEALRGKCIAVDDTLDAVQALAKYARKKWAAMGAGRRVIGVTGSAGKTTTKEAVAQVLGARFRVLKSEGNLNNYYGMPLQLLKLEPEHEVAVIEMGMSFAGEIARLASVAEPDWGVVTNVAAVHTQNFADGIEGVAKAKRELVESVPASGIAFLNADDERVAAFAKATKAKVITYGFGEGAQVRGSNWRADGVGASKLTVTAGGESSEVTLQLPGRHNALNALAAIAVGRAAGISLERCAAAMGEMLPAQNRGQILRVRDAIVINDCYNSNPRALEAMVDVLKQTPAQRRIVIAGEMLELGPDAEKLHAACGEYIARAGADLLIGVRGLARPMVEAASAAGTEARFVASPEEAGAWLRTNLQAGDAVLLKASRGVKLERALEGLFEADSGGKAVGVGAH